MKKLTLLIMMAAMLMLPMWANAALTPMGTGNLTVKSSSPTAYNTDKLDFDGKVTGGNPASLNTSSTGNPQGENYVEMFCLEHNVSYSNSTSAYSFYKVDTNVEDKISKAAWIADNYLTYQLTEQRTGWHLNSSGYNVYGNYTYTFTQDELKGEAQKAIWKIANNVDLLEGSGLDKILYNASASFINYSTEKWVYAKSPVPNSGAPNYQDFLVQYNPPTQSPEPASLLLFGLGLLGLAGIRRKMKK